MKDTCKSKGYGSIFLIEYVVFIMSMSVMSTFWLTSAESNGQEDRFGYTCEHERLTISCDTDANIHITDALYGYDWGDGEPRINCTQTEDLNLNEGEPCLAEESTNIVSNKCNGKTTCSVEASNNVFGDPCRGTFKYLRVNYTCVPKITSSLLPGSFSSTLHQTTPSSETKYTVADDMATGSFSSTLHQTTPSSETTNKVAENDKALDARPATLWPIAFAVVIPSILPAVIYLIIKRKKIKPKAPKKETASTNDQTPNIYTAAEKGMHISSMDDGTTSGGTTGSVSDKVLYEEVHDVEISPPATYAQTINKDSYLPGEFVYNTAYGSY